MSILYKVVTSTVGALENVYNVETIEKLPPTHPDNQTGQSEIVFKKADGSEIKRFQGMFVVSIEKIYQ